MTHHHLFARCGCSLDEDGMPSGDCPLHSHQAKLDEALALIGKLRPVLVNLAPDLVPLLDHIEWKLPEEA